MTLVKGRLQLHLEEVLEAPIEEAFTKRRSDELITSSNEARGRGDYAGARRLATKALDEIGIEQRERLMRECLLINKIPPTHEEKVIKEIKKFFGSQGYFSLYERYPENGDGEIGTFAPDGRIMRDARCYIFIRKEEIKGPEEEKGIAVGVYRIQGENVLQVLSGPF